jgi:hypothetical protein
MRKYDQYRGVRDIINKVRQLAFASSNQYLKEDLKGWRTENWESDPLGPFLPYLSELSPQLKADLSKVDFDWENYTSGTDLIDQAWRSRSNQTSEFGYSLRIIGPHNRMGPEGVSWIGCSAGGDWEQPIFFMLYMSNDQVRAWIPKKGNCWNYDTHTALGNDEDADSAFFKKEVDTKYEEGSYDGADVLRDSDVILRSIKDHFEPNPHVPPKRKK